MKNFLFILSRNNNSYVDSLRSINIDKKIIYDTTYTDKECASSGFVASTRTVKQPSSWDKVFYHIHLNQEVLQQYDYFYFLEDDVYTKNINTFNEILETLHSQAYDFISTKINSKNNSLDWYWWKRETKSNQYYTYPYMSFNPLCRLSSRLIEKVLQFRIRYNKFDFHEIMFASLCMQYDFTYCDYTNLIDQYIGTFHYRPIIDIDSIIDNKIYHPVKPKYVLAKVDVDK